MHWISSAATGKARAAIRRYWQDKSEQTISKKEKQYTSTLVIDLPDQPGMLGEISTLIGLNGCNILNVELLKRVTSHLQFSFDKRNNEVMKFN